MPVYEFSCGECGSFDLVRPVADVEAPAECPSCGTRARRRFTPPGLALLDRPMRRALDSEEKSAHEPAVVSERRGRPLPHRHGHGHGAPMPWVVGH
jgi:putative FmdB family regulatory protein